ncbi:endochitinase-like [Rhipicephalus microplus]|uniref:endochitinase-like n=1 Tax=Rhipicephalus microplus TaxID=6941 RepID=UPI003F6C8BD8
MVFLFQIDRAELIVEKGASRQSIVLEVPLSARTYITTPTASGVHTVFSGFSGNYTNLQGSLASFEVCDLLQSGWKERRSSPGSCPFIMKDEEYVSYEDDESIQKKANMVMGRKYRGVAVRSVDLDDYNSQCAGKSNLLKGLRSTFDAAKPDVEFPYKSPRASCLDKHNKMTPTTAPSQERTTSRLSELSTQPKEAVGGTKTPPSGLPETSSLAVPTSKDPPTVPNTPETVPVPKELPVTQSLTQALLTDKKISAPASGEPLTVTPAESPLKSSILATTKAVTTKSSADICKGDNQGAMLPHESDCSKYYHCAHSKPHLQFCAPGTIFDIERQVCNWPANARRPECKLP